MRLAEPKFRVAEWNSRAQVLFPAPQVLFPAPQVLFPAPQVRFSAAQVLFSAPQVLVSAAQVLFPAAQVLGTLSAMLDTDLGLCCAAVSASLAASGALKPHRLAVTTCKLGTRAKPTNFALLPAFGSLKSKTLTPFRRMPA
jgi:hypothetical protein